MSLHLNTICALEDFSQPELGRWIRILEQDFLPTHPDYPSGREHRKSWEWALTMHGLDRLGVIRPEAMVLGVAAGHEPVVFELTKHVRWVFATDIYGMGNFQNYEADAEMLWNPRKFARAAFNPRRLVVQSMDARALRFEDETFDGVFCLSSIEHFDGFEGSVSALNEIHRVLKPGGVVVLTSELVINGKRDLSLPHLELFSPPRWERLISAVAGLKLVEPFRLRTEALARIQPIPLSKALSDAQLGHADYPHIVLELEGRHFTSASAFLRKQ